MVARDHHFPSCLWRFFLVPTPRLPCTHTCVLQQAKAAWAATEADARTVPNGQLTLAHRGTMLHPVVPRSTHLTLLGHLLGI